MASNVSSSWRCQLCFGSYVYLKDLVSHVRAAHSSEASLNYVCQVQGCPRIFKRPSTWYKHVINVHSEKYWGGSISGDFFEEMNAEEMNAEENSDDNFDQMDDSEYEQFQQEECPVLESAEEIIVGKLVKLKQHHRLSNVAVENVVELVDSVCSELSTKAVSVIRSCGENLGMDLSSQFFERLPGIFESLTSPLASVETSYKQQLYIANNLPYVVRAFNTYFACLCLHRCVYMD